MKAPKTSIFFLILLALFTLNACKKETFQSSDLDQKQQTLSDTHLTAKEGDPELITVQEIKNLLAMPPYKEEIKYKIDFDRKMEFEYQKKIIVKLPVTDAPVGLNTVLCLVIEKDKGIIDANYINYKYQDFWHWTVNFYDLKLTLEEEIPMEHGKQGPSVPGPSFCFTHIILCEIFNTNYNNGTSGPSYVYITANPDPGTVGGTGGPNNGTIQIIGAQLGLNSDQMFWLDQHPDRANEIYNYLQSSNNPDANSICMEHIDEMMNNAGYLTFVEGHANTGTPNQVWWEDQVFIQNPANFPFPITPIGWIPYHCSYQLTQHEQDVFDQLDAEDQLNANQNLDCKGTKRTGNINFQGTKEHLLIQLHYVFANPLSGEVEFKIPNASIANPANPGYADIVNLGYGNIFEIKPNNQAGTQAGVLEVDNYVAKANINCSGTLAVGVWNKGGSYGTTYLPTSVSGRFLKAELTAPGVIGYSYVDNFTPPSTIPVVVPSSVLDKIKHLIERLKNNLTDADRIIAEYLKDNPELVTYIQSAAIGVATAIIVGTILEDMATAGAGVWNDWVSFTLSYRIIRFAVAL